MISCPSGLLKCRVGVTRLSPAILVIRVPNLHCIGYGTDNYACSSFDNRTMAIIDVLTLAHELSLLGHYDCISKYLILSSTSTL